MTEPMKCVCGGTPRRIDEIRTVGGEHRRINYRCDCGVASAQHETQKEAQYFWDHMIDSVNCYFTMAEALEEIAGDLRVEAESVEQERARKAIEEIGL